MKKRALSLLAALCMIMTLLPELSLPAAAAEAWLWPSAYSTYVTSNYGYRDLNNDGAISSDEKHYGIDIGAPGGSDVRAAKSGTIYAARNTVPSYYRSTTSQTEGNYVAIDHGDGTYSIYMHMLPGCRTGGKVKQGEIIGQVGSTGWSDGDHLHFQIYTNPNNRNGSTLNPMATNSNVTYKNAYIPVDGWASQQTTYIFEPTQALDSKEISFWDYNQPNTLTEGKGFNIRGFITSGSKLTNVTVGVYNVNDVMKTGKSVTPSYKAYSIDVIDSDVHVKNLQEGVYRYVVKATNSAGTTKELVNKVFNILPNGDSSYLKNGTYVLKTIEGDCAVDVQDRSNANGANVQLGALDYSPYQTFQFFGMADGSFVVVNAGSGLALTVHNSGTANATNVELAPLKHTDAQCWYVLPCGQTFCLVPKVATERGLDIAGKIAAGKNLQIYTTNMTKAQRFYLEQVTADFRGNHIQFDLNGGTIAESVKTHAFDGVNTPRASATMIVYNVSNIEVPTNKYGHEIAVNADGSVVAKRAYDNETHLTVPAGGFVVSAMASSGYDGGSFVRDIPIGDYVTYDPDSMLVKTYGSDRNAYLYDSKYVASGAAYGALPVPEREGYTFGGWYTAAEGGREITADSLYSVSKLYAHWDGGLTISTQPQDAAGTVGEKVTFSVAAEGENLTYQWQYSDDNGKTWKASSSKSTAATCTLSSVNRDGWLYRCIVKDGSGNTVTSDTAKVIVKPSITTQPQNASGKVGEVVKFTIAAQGKGLTYQWQYSDDNGKTWKASSSKSTTATCTLTASRDGWLYCCIITAGNGETVTSNQARVTVLTGPVITSQPKDASGKVGEVLKFTIAAQGKGLTYQWQYSMDGGKTWKASSSTSTTATCTLSASRNGWLYRCIVKSSGGSVTSNTAKVTVKPAITSQPKDASGKVGDVLKFTIAASGDGLTYQWQYSTDNGKTWQASSSRSTTATCTLTSAERDGWLYRCIVKDSHGSSVTSATARVTVKIPLKITSQPKAYTGPVGDTAKFTVTAQGSGLKYQWQYSDDNGKTWQASSSKTATATCYIKADRDGWLYRCIITDQYGDRVTSSNARLLIG